MCAGMAMHWEPRVAIRAQFRCVPGWQLGPWFRCVPGWQLGPQVGASGVDNFEFGY